MHTYLYAELAQFQLPTIQRNTGQYILTGLWTSESIIKAIELQHVNFPRFSSY